MEARIVGGLDQMEAIIVGGLDQMEARIMGGLDQMEARIMGGLDRARNLWYFGSKCYHVFSFATGILMW